MTSPARVSVASGRGARVARWALALGLVVAAAAAASAVAPGPKLTGTDEIGASQFGNSLALSARGDIAFIGGWNDRSLIGALEGKRVHSQAIGAAWAFERAGAGWKQQGGKLTATGERGPGGFGDSVALSADGRTALIGGPSGFGGIGAAWVFTRSGSAWRQQAMLLPRGRSRTRGYVTEPTGFGASVAMSADGGTALIGGPFVGDGAGAAWIFTRSGSRWRQKNVLNGKGESGNGLFGQSVSLSGDGSTALVGAPFDDNGNGAVWAFRRSGSGWEQQGGKLTGRGKVGYPRFGSATALSGDGNTALVGGPVDADGIGAAWLFTRSDSKWKQGGSKLLARDEVGLGQFGDSVALSSNGNRALVGGALDRDGPGAAWVFRRSGSGVSQQGPKLTARRTTGPGPVQFGSSVALSATGTTALVGAVGDGDFAGAAWVFHL
jgi:hypothetical protein